ncbi:MAG: hypothetical protein ACRDPA_11590, partial [Solirubrobacteraceae bacterium]
MRVTAAFSRLLALPGIWVRDVEFLEDRVVVSVALRRWRLACPHCDYSSWGRYDTRAEPTTWRHLDLGVWRVEVAADLRRIEEMWATQLAESGGPFLF